MSDRASQTPPRPDALPEGTVRGLHDFLIERVLRRLARPGERVVDLGAGSGALAMKMLALGLEPVAVDQRRESFRATVPFVELDLNDPVFSDKVGAGRFGIVTAVEVIEHVEAPVNLLRNAKRLLKPGGHIVISTPNVDNIPARVKFLLTGKIRMMDQSGDATHMSPIFWDLFNRQMLPRAGLELREHHVYPANGYIVTRRRYTWAMRALGWVLRGDCNAGDNHIVVLRSSR
ncbi:MAG: hypothetical protein DMD86_16390 [Candidatus Rokuibacteriota bacterium]|nr:MAG: hypothetical protein DMD86_16390 [Candidatus Rokubacteria bacterium]